MGATAMALQHGFYSMGPMIGSTKQAARIMQDKTKNILLAVKVTFKVFSAACSLRSPRIAKTPQIQNASPRGKAINGPGNVEGSANITKLAMVRIAPTMILTIANPFAPLVFMVVPLSDNRLHIRPVVFAPAILMANITYQYFRFLPAVQVCALHTVFVN
jgi:hypothetical protein